MNPFDPGTAEYAEFERQEAAEGEQNSRVKLVRMSDVVRERIDWLWPGYLARGKLHVVDGDPGLGKSTATTDLGARITAGKPWPDGQPGCAAAGVVILSGEDGLGDTIRPRFEAAGADLERVVALSGITSWDAEAGETYERMPALPKDIPYIRQAAEHVGAALVVIDPLMAYLGGDVNSHRDQDVRRALAPLARMAEETGTAIVLVRHLTKGGGNNALYRGGGSIGIIGAARIGFTFARDPEDDGRVIVACTKANITVMPPSLAYRLVDSPDHGCARVEWHDGPVDYSATDLLHASQESQDDREDRNDTVEWLRAYLAGQGGQADFADLKKAAKAEGVNERTLRRARDRAGVVTERTGFPSRSVWMFRAQSGHSEPSPASPDTHESVSGLAGLVSPLSGLKTGQDGEGDPPSPSVPRQCRVCRLPMSDPSPGVDTHPNCDPGADA